MVSAVVRVCAMSIYNYNHHYDKYAREKYEKYEKVVCIFFPRANRPCGRMSFYTFITSYYYRVQPSRWPISQNGYQSTAHTLPTILFIIYTFSHVYNKRIPTWFVIYLVFSPRGSQIFGRSSLFTQQRRWCKLCIIWILDIYIYRWYYDNSLGIGR